ncbi:MAG: hydantoinase/oxoprolinase family protein, partial [Minwuiales bacterium]|nr:hydantoinase/oxoprolinase family protein [Minwuiales bacterium]
MTEIGVDIGGTFTDVVCRRAGEPLKIVKIPSTRADPSVAVLRSVKHMVETWGVDPAEIARFVHGTTVATNAVIERKGAKIGLLTTQGFKDVLEIGRQMRQAMYDLVLEPETPVFLAPGRYRKEVPERLDAEGQVLVPLDEAAVVAAVRDLVDDGVEAVAVCFLFSFLNPRHEQRARVLIEENFPGLMVSLSCEVDPAFREYERTAVTAFDAYVKPVIDRYLERLEGGIAEAGVSAPLQVMMSRGGAAASSIVRQRPVRLFLSGPA